VFKGPLSSFRRSDNPQSDASHPLSCLISFGALFMIDRAPAHRASAMAGYGLVCTVEIIVDSQFLSIPNPTEAYIKNMPLHDSGFEVGFTGMVDEFGAGTAYGPVHGPVTIEAEHVLAVLTPFSFPTADPFAGVLDDLPPGRNHFIGVDAPALDL